MPAEPAEQPARRPATKPSLLSDEIQTKVVDALRGGSWVKDAAEYGGISERRYHKWVSRGVDYDEHLEDGGEIIDGEDAYRKFALACNLARAEARVSASRSLRAAWVDGDWRAAAAFLAASDRGSWERVSKVEMSGPDGGPIELDVTATEMRLAESIRVRREEIIEEAVVVDSTTQQIMGVPIAAVTRWTSDDDEDDYYLLPPVDPSVFDFDLDD